MVTETAAPREDATVGEMLSVLLRPVLSYKTHIIVFCLSTVLVSLALTYVYSEKYQAATTIVFRPQQVTQLRHQESVAFGAPLPKPPFELIYDNLALLARSEPILFEIIDRLNLDEEESASYSGPWYIQFYERAKDWAKETRDKTWSILKHGRVIEQSPRAAALRRVRENLQLINHNSYVFYLAYIDKRPLRAAMVVDNIAELIVQALVDKHQEPGRERIKQLQILRDEKIEEIEHYQDAIRQLLESNEIAALDQHVDRTLERYSELTLKRIQLEGTIAGTRARLAALDEQGARRNAASGGLQPEDYRRLKSERLFTDIELQAQLEEHAEIRATTTRLDRQLARIPSIRREYNTYTQYLQNAQRDLVTITDQFEEARMLASTTISEAYIPHDAQVPEVPVQPIKVYHVALAGGLALALSVGMAYLLAFVRSDLSSATMARAITSMSTMWDGVDRRRQERRGTSTAPYTGPERRRQPRRGSDIAGSASDRRRGSDIAGSASDRRRGSDAGGGEQNRRRASDADSEPDDRRRDTDDSQRGRRRDD